ncbi:MAG: helix-turn-helix transcriptional regulator [Clostridia bacterium]|nr:helix-turn-helix transcriptional regulator [Clostridia bacterium]
MRLKDIREDRDITQKEIADYLHIKQNTYSQYESGKRQLPIEALIALADYYHVTTDYLLGVSDIPNPYRDNRKKQ